MPINEKFQDTIDRLEGRDVMRKTLASERALMQEKAKTVAPSDGTIAMRYLSPAEFSALKKCYGIPVHYTMIEGACHVWPYPTGQQKYVDGLAAIVRRLAHRLKRRSTEESDNNLADNALALAPLDEENLRKMGDTN